MDENRPPYSVPFICGDPAAAPSRDSASYSAPFITVSPAVPPLWVVQAKEKTRSKALSCVNSIQEKPWVQPEYYKYTASYYVNEDAPALLRRIAGPLLLAARG